MAFFPPFCAYIFAGYAFYEVKTWITKPRAPNVRIMTIAPNRQGVKSTSAGKRNNGKRDMVTAKRNRPDKDGTAKSAYEKNRRRILASTDICALCGKPVDKRLKYPHPMCATIDHIIPIAKGGHPSAMENLQLAHLVCNQLKGAKLTIENNKDLVKEEETISNRDLPLSFDWYSMGG